MKGRNYSSRSAAQREVLPAGSAEVRNGWHLHFSSLRLESFSGVISRSSSKEILAAKCIFAQIMEPCEMMLVEERKALKLRNDGTRSAN